MSVPDDAVEAIRLGGVWLAQVRSDMDLEKVQALVPKIIAAIDPKARNVDVLAALASLIAHVLSDWSTDPEELTAVQIGFQMHMASLMAAQATARSGMTNPTGKPH